jgi:hypothetical protein
MEGPVSKKERGPYRYRTEAETVFVYSPFFEREVFCIYDAAELRDDLNTAYLAGKRSRSNRRTP